MHEAGPEKKLVIDTSLFVAYQCSYEAPLIRVARQDRKWMDDATKRFPYRCLPMVVANSFGWDVLNPTGFTAVWNGGALPSDVKVSFPTHKKSNIPCADFGAGVLTFTLGHIFRTSPGINLYVKGSPNEPKDGIIPLEGIVETDSSPATFTMNYLFTRKNYEVSFEAGESYCRIFPIPRFMTEVFDPEIRMLEENPELHELHMKWRTERDKFNKGLSIPGSEYVERGWQKDYFQGGGALFPKFLEHQTKLKQPEFRDCRPEKDRRDLHPDVGQRKMILRAPDGKALTIFVDNLVKKDRVDAMLNRREVILTQLCTMQANRVVGHAVKQLSIILNVLGMEPTTEQEVVNLTIELQASRTEIALRVFTAQERQNKGKISRARGIVEGE